MNPSVQPGQNYDRRPERPDHLIDQALRRLGSATPAPDIEDRISARLAQEQSKTHVIRAKRVRFFSVPRFAIGAVATLACVAIILGSVNHSRRIQPTLPGIGTHQNPSGVGAAGAVRPANRPVSPPPAAHPRSARRLPEGRAVISPQSQKPAGVAVPKTLSPAP
jgi:hypothetical protein